MKKIVLAALMVAGTYLVASEGANLTKNCAACHGINFTKAPLGRKHHIVRDSKARMIKMMKYYQHPKDPDEMVMKPQVANLTDAQISTIADYIIAGLPASDTKAVALTKSCVACHGVDFTKPPLGRKHHIVRDSKARMIKMMKYYQNPKDSDEMVMKPQVVNLTDAQINAIADYILNLKK